MCLDRRMTRLGPEAVGVYPQSALQLVQEQALQSLHLNQYLVQDLHRWTE